MRRKRIAAMVTVLAALVAALVAAGVGTAKVNATTISLVTPSWVAPDSAFAVSGVTNPAGEHVHVGWFANATCSGDMTDDVCLGDSNDETGAYATTLNSPLVPGVYSYQAWIWDTPYESSCNTVYVGVAPPGPIYTSSGPDRYGFCSVAGNTYPDGTPIPVGTFLNLLQDQPATDDHYTGATPAFWMEGVGITCDVSPAQAALAADSGAKVNHVGQKTTHEGPLFYPFVPSG
jgi:hypothetical protein